MGEKVKNRPGSWYQSQSGYTMIVVVILLLLGSIMVSPLLLRMSTGLKTGLLFESKTQELYAADAGVNDGFWTLKEDKLATRITGYEDYDWSTVWQYDLPRQVNGRDVRVSIENVWVPDYDPATLGLNDDDLEAIIQQGKLVVAGTVAGSSSYKIKITFIPDAGEELLVETVGIWLPSGFTYDAGSSNLETIGEDYYSVPVVTPHNGGQSVLWSFPSVPLESFPGVNPGDPTLVTEITFDYTPVRAGASLSAVPLITTSGISDSRFSWSADVKVYKITATCGDTEVEAYSIDNELRALISAIDGDYRAIGNTLMVQGGGLDWRIRYQLLSESDATANDIPADAQVSAAYLYWSGWFEEAMTQTIFADNCSDFGSWSNGSDWVVSSGRFSAHHYSDADGQRYLTMDSSLDLSPYASGTVAIGWQQWEAGALEAEDKLQFRFSGDGGSSWGDPITAFSDDIGSWPQDYSYIIPDEYLSDDFRVQFYAPGWEGAGSGGEERCYIDNIAVEQSVLTADTSVVFEIDSTQVYLDGGVPIQGAQEIVADSYQVINNFDYGNPHGYSYSSFKDVTALVRAFTTEGANGNYPGNATYTVGNVSADTGDHWSYAGWSLLLIYTSGDTQGHRIYLYDDFLYCDHDTNLDFDQDGNPGGIISGFLVPAPISGEVNAAQVTCFVGEGDDMWNFDSLVFNGTALSNAASPANDVWNGDSPGLSAPGVDIDTFDITWASSLLEPGDSTAQVDITTETDIWNLVYIVLSFRDESSSSGAMHYTIR